MLPLCACVFNALQITLKQIWGGVGRWSGVCPKESSKTWPFLPSHNPALQQKPHGLPYIITDITVPPRHTQEAQGSRSSVIPAAGGVEGPRVEGLGWQVRRAVLNTACTSGMARPVDAGSPGQEAPEGSWWVAPGTWKGRCWKRMESRGGREAGTSRDSC